MRKRDITIIIITLVLILAGTQIFHIIRYNTLQNRIISEFCEQSDSLALALNALAQPGETAPDTQQAQSIAYALGALVDYLGNSKLPQEQLSELTMFLWLLPDYLRAQQGVAAELAIEAQELSGIFADWAQVAGQKDPASQLYAAMHSSVERTQACVTVLNHG